MEMLPDGAVINLSCCLSEKRCYCCISRRNKTERRLAKTRGTLSFINFNNRWPGFCLLDFFGKARFLMRALFCIGTDPCKNTLRRRSPLYEIHMQIPERFCPDKDPTNKIVRECTAPGAVQQAAMTRSCRANMRIVTFGSDARVAKATQTCLRTHKWLRV